MIHIVKAAARRASPESKAASLMAEGWESLGEEELGDLPAFLKR
jgi:hypothetical protein